MVQDVESSKESLLPAEVPVGIKKVIGDIVAKTVAENRYII